jgi:GBP family porin
MKKTLVASAILGALSGMAHAQSAITVYGIVDAGLVSERGGAAGTITKLTSGVGSTSRLGFRGSEDLGGGLSANFVLESGIKIDTGEQDVAGTLFNRQSLVGLKSASAGALTLGRQYTPFYVTVSTVADPFGAGYAGSAKNLFPTAGNNTRSSNTVLYTSPSVSGVSAEVAYALGEQGGSNSAGRQFGAALAYANGPLNARLAYNNRNNEVTAAATPAVPAANNGIGSNTLLAANYTFALAKAFLAYGVDKGFNSAPLANTSNPFGGVKPTASIDSRDFLAGVSVPLGAGTIMASYIRKDDRTALNQDASQWALGYSYALSARTSAYSSLAKITNKRGAGYTVGNNTDVGTGDKAFNLGMRHSF